MLKPIISKCIASPFWLSTISGCPVAIFTLFASPYPTLLINNENSAGMLGLFPPFPDHRQIHHVPQNKRATNPDTFHGQRNRIQIPRHKQPGERIFISNRSSERVLFRLCGGSIFGRYKQNGSCSRLLCFQRPRTFQFSTKMVDAFIRNGKLLGSSQLSFIISHFQIQLQAIYGWASWPLNMVNVPLNA